MSVLHETEYQQTEKPPYPPASSQFCYLYFYQYAFKALKARLPQIMKRKQLHRTQNLLIPASGQDPKVEVT